MSNIITTKVAQEIVSHEAIVREAYLDSVDVWTWSVGITDSSGHAVHPRYLDNPQTVRRCLEVFLSVLDDKYKPDVDEVFSGHPLTEEQFAAALSFHYNTGGIAQAAWAKEWKEGDFAEARESFMNWRRPPEIIPRREKERDLFFDGTWSNAGTALVIPVRKPSYKPDIAAAQHEDISAALDELLGTNA